jgi:hypothetical protein
LSFRHAGCPSPTAPDAGGSAGCVERGGANRPRPDGHSAGQDFPRPRVAACAGRPARRRRGASTTPRRRLRDARCAPARRAGEIEQIAAHDHGAVVDVSFLLRPAEGAPLFIVDTWAKVGDGWRLQVRYAAPVARAVQRVPGEGDEAVIPKKY